ncbi:hypothetical protein BGZ83_004903, partial [Gryganskiella cystojenkinii]
ADYDGYSSVTSPTTSTPSLNTLAQQTQTPLSSISQPQMLPQARIYKSTALPGGGSSAASVAAASKQAEENRRSEEAARTRRKIADLEISNASLLQVNQSLEATIRKQAAEMQELKMRIQSAPFELGYDLGLGTSSHGDHDSLTSIQLQLEQDEESRKIQEMRTESDRQADMTFKRLCLSIEQMLFEARQALEQSMKPTGVKVLSSFDMYEKEAMEDDDDMDEGFDIGGESILFPDGYRPDEEDEKETADVFAKDTESDHKDMIQLDSAIELQDPSFLGHRPP